MKYERPQSLLIAMKEADGAPICRDGSGASLGSESDIYKCNNGAALGTSSVLCANGSGDSHGYTQCETGDSEGFSGIPCFLGNDAFDEPSAKSSILGVK